MRARLTALGTIALTTALLASPALAAPPAKTPGRAIEGFAPYQPQTTCSPTAKPGTVALRTLVLKAYGGTGDYGIIRDCSLGGRSEHKEGRAWDWKVSAANAAQVKQVNDLLHWLFATDRYGNTYAQARRLGIMYVIWNHRIWNANTHAWKAYTGSDPHTSHVHLSLSWAGALARTSYWTGKVSGVVPAPAAPKAPAAPARPAPPAPKPLTGTSKLGLPSNAAKGIASAFVLQAGTSYLIKAEGTYTYDLASHQADAECSRLADGTWSRRTAAEQQDRNSQALDVQVNGESTRWYTGTERGCDTATHAYTTVITPPATTRLTLKVVDAVPADNKGVLTMTISPEPQH